MKSNFNDCLNRLLKDEGGYINDPNDSGGATNFGITISDYRSYINPNGSPLDVQNMGINEARRIYKTKYWDAIGGDSLASGVDYTCFDYAVHSGLGRPRKALQRFKNLSGTSLIDSINNERTAFLEALTASRPKDQKFLKGWLARVKRVRDYSHFLESHQDTKTGPTSGAAIGGVAVGLSKYFQAHQAAIIIGGLTLALVAGVAIHIYRNKGK